MNEVFYLVRHANFSYNDLMNMPTYQRKYFIELLIQEFEKRSS